MCIIGPVLVKTKKKGKYNLLFKHYTYRRITKSKKGVVWKCTASKTDDCKAMLTTDDNLNIVSSRGEHSHKQTAEDAKPKHVYFTTQ